MHTSISLGKDAKLIHNLSKNDRATLAGLFMQLAGVNPTTIAHMLVAMDRETMTQFVEGMANYLRSPDTLEEKVLTRTKPKK